MTLELFRLSRPVPVLRMTVVKTEGERQYRDEPWDSRQYRANNELGIGKQRVHRPMPAS